nr:uncharacterized protein LOC129454107 [Misgurnus anguillicaudatus]
MSQKTLVDFEISDSDDNTVPPSPSASPRRSSRIQARVCPWNHWPSDKIIHTLEDFGIHARSDLSRTDLVLLASNTIGNPPAEPTDSSPAANTTQAHPKPAAKKRTAKSSSPPAKKSKSSTSTLSPSHDSRGSNSQLLKAIQGLTENVKNLQNRMGAFEAVLATQPGTSLPSTSTGSRALSAPPSFPDLPTGPSTSSVTPAFPPSTTQIPFQSVPLPSVTPHFTLSTAVAAQSFGRPFVPPAAVTVSQKMRSDIINGKNINLAALLLPSPAVDRQMVDCGDVAVYLKTSDPRLHRNLSFCEFVTAFGTYRDIMCQVFPERREELDIYLAMLADLNLRYGGTLFYEYHKSFSAKAASFVTLFNTKLDWSITDSELLVRHFGGQKTLACAVCSSHGHSAPFCPKTLTARAAPAVHGADSAHLLQGPASKICLPTTLQACDKRTSAVSQKILNDHLSTPINITILSSYLSSHPDPSFVDYLITGLSQGFRVGVLYPMSTSYVANNLQSALTEPDVVSCLVAKELNKGYLIGPFSSPPFSPFRVNSIGIATRKYSGKKRLIFDMSSPHSNTFASVNECIPLEPFSLYYASVDNAIHLIKIAGLGACLAKADITDAFKIMPIHPSDWPLFGIKWESKFYFAVRLTFGCRSSPHIFNCLSEALCWILLNVCNLPFVLHLLDDFLLIDFPSSRRSVLDILKHLFCELGIPLSNEKTMGPSTSIEFLGIILDSIKMQASLPIEKLVRIRSFIESFLERRTVSKHDMLSLLGHLNFAMRIIPQGRSFISRLLTLAHSVVNLTDTITLDEGCASDLRFWSHLLKNWNGVSFFYNDNSESSAELELYTDAAPSIGFGGYFQGEWFSEKWPPAFSHLTVTAPSIACYELYPIAVASVLWGPAWSRKRITMYCDNVATVEIINKGRSHCQAIMSILRRVTWQSVINNFTIKAEHIPGKSNAIADALSRFRLQAFRRLCPAANDIPTPCPTLHEIILD